MSNRQIARDLGVAPETINRHLARLGRHAMLFHTLLMQTAKPASHFSLDGFVSFEWSQFFPFHHHLAVEKKTDFFIYFTDSEVRRSGRMTAAQKKRRAQLEKQYGRPDPKAVRKDVRHLVKVVIGRQPEVTIDTDEHRDYPLAMRGLAVKIIHRVTSSREYRGNKNPLWEINLLDMLIRHSGANHKRETIAWSKRRQGSADRMAIFLIWRNYMKGRSEKVRGSPTPAMARGVLDKPLQAKEILSERLFPTRIELPERWEDYYRRRVETRVLGQQRRHNLTYAM